MVISEFCGNSTFWENDILSSRTPKLTTCFLKTIPVLVPTLWLVLSFPFFVFGSSKLSANSIPLRTLSIFKTGICVLLTLLGLFDLYANYKYGYTCSSDNNSPTSYTIASVFNITNYIYLCIITQITRKRGVASSWILWIFWLFVMVCAVLPVQDNILNQASCLSSILSYISYAFICVQTVLYSLAESPSVYGYQRIGKPVCPKPTSSVISKPFLWWFTPIVRLCYKRTINKDDLWDQHPELQAERVVNELHSVWSEEVKTALRQRSIKKRQSFRGEYTRNGHIPGEETSLLQRSYCNDAGELPKPSKAPSLAKCCLRLYALEWFSASCIMLFCDAATLIQPLLLRLVVKETEKASAERIVWYGVVLTVLLYVLGQLSVFFYVHSGQQVLALGLKAKTALIGVLYRKTLNVRSSVRKDYTVGEVVNLVSVDCQRIQDAFMYSNFILSSFVVLIFGTYEIWDVMGPSTIGCLAVLVVITSINVLLGKLQEGYLLKVLHDKGKRCKLLNEIISGIKVIKMYAWEPFFSRKLKNIRLKEMSVLLKLARVTACSIVCSIPSAFLMNFALLALYTLTSAEVFDAEKAFLALSVINVMRFSLSLIPFIVTAVIQAIVSLNRIQQYLLTEDLIQNNVEYVSSADYAVSIHRGSFSWDKNTAKPILSGINVDIKEGILIGVVGQVGSGKTSFISSILGELEKLSGDVKIKGSVAYISQEAWIQNATVKDNILYGRAFNERKYERVLEGCCLKTDLQILSAGDMTEIGERGINLSGGQKQRINLARAVYSNSDIYLFDDPLSAVDSHVGKDIFKKVIGPGGMLRKKTRILVTHGVHWLPKVDEIIVFDHGCISEQGKFKQLVLHNGPFSQFLETYLLKEADEEDENDPEIYKLKHEIYDQIERLTSDGLTSDDGLLLKDGISPKLRKLSQREGIKRKERQFSSGTNKTDTTRHNGVSLRQSSRKFSESLESNIKHRLIAQGRLIQEETSQEGSVNKSVFTEFSKAMGVPTVIIAIFCLLAQQGMQIACNLWITFWTEDSYLKNATLIHTQKYTETKYYYLGVYGLLVALQGVALFLYAIITFTRFVRATGKIHHRGLDCVLRSPMSFFDTTPVGRIMNRFSSDIDIMDDKFPRSFRTMSLYALILIGTVIVITFTTPVAAIAFVPIFLMYIGVVRFYLPCARQLKRIESVTRSPLYNHFSESISGASIIRAYRSVDRFINEVYRRLDINSAFYYAANTGTGWIACIIQSLGTLMLLAVSLFGILSSEINGADLGLAITYSFQLVLAMSALIRAITDMQMNVISLERIEEYMFLTPEADLIQRQRPAIDWPHKGTIGFDNYKTRYRPGLELVLKGITFFVRSGEKVGIVGRTGAGKSSLTQALFRLIEPAEGHIQIDDIPTTSIGLHDLRQKITILPQDPVLFSDTLRLNLDPLVKFSETEIWKAIECAHLKQFIMNQPGQLMSEIGEGGNNLSVGQRQLVCLARTLLHKTNILILDEATAAVDMETDDLIQQTIREQFSDCTILCIAHRLSTVMDYDRIMVMDNGMIAEFDTPDNLLKDKDGVFYSMAKDAGICLS